MKASTTPRWVALAFALLIVSAQFPMLRAADSPSKSQKPKLYATAADGKQQIASAIEAAAKENKRIILKFGADW
jgi:hypothetical protein